MAVIENLSENEKYLWALLSDPSGLDLAEFVFQDYEATYGRWRAWAFQWKWFRCTDPLQADQCSRSVGKTTSIRVRAFAFPFLHPGQEMMITAPELIHLNPIISMVEYEFRNTRLGREMLPAGKSQGFTHRPFQADFLNGSRIIGRIPQRDGKGLKGAHPLWLEMDEAQDMPEPAWTEVIETLKRGHEGAVWRAHGVTRGMRDSFFKITQDESDFTVHRYSAMWRPTWSDQERQEKIKLYGSRNHPDYKRNILGEHSDEQSPILVLHKLMQCVDQDQSSDYNLNQYKFISLTHEYINEWGEGDAIRYLEIPKSHLENFQVFWCGMDVGFVRDPSEIVVFGEADEKLTLLTRLHLERLTHAMQANTIIHLLDLYRPRAFGMDKTGLGLPLFQDVQDRAPHLAEMVKGYNFSEKLLVDFDKTIEIDEFKGDLVRDAGIERNVLEVSTDILRGLVDDQKVILPWDKDLIDDLRGQTYAVVRDPMGPYGKRRFSQGNFHLLDATRMAVLARARAPIELFIKEDPFEPPPTIFLE